MNTYYYKLRTKVAVSQEDKIQYVRDVGHNTVLGSGLATGLFGGVVGLGAGAAYNLGGRLFRPDGQIIDRAAERRNIYLGGLLGGLSLGGFGTYKQYVQNKAIEEMVGNPNKVNSMYKKFKDKDKELRSMGIRIPRKDSRVII